MSIILMGAPVFCYVIFNGKRRGFFLLGGAFSCKNVVYDVQILSKAYMCI